MMQFGINDYLTLDALETRIATHRHFSERADDVEATVLDRLQLPRDGALLDVGAGTGTFLTRVRQQGHTGRLVGVDQSPASAAQVRKAGAAEGLLADAQNLPFPAAYFDVVTCRHVLYHVPDPDLALREFRRVVASGGQVVATVNHPHGLPMLTSLVCTELEAVGVKPNAVSGWVNSDDLPGRMHAVFDEVETIRHDNALVFTQPEPVIRFAVAILGIYGLPAESPMRTEVVERLRQRVAEWFAANDEPWRDPKGYSICIGQVL